MALSQSDLFAFLEDLCIATETVRHAPLFTVEESQALRGEIPGGHCKNLFLKDKKGQLWLIVALEDAAIDLKTLHKRIGAGRLSFGKPELLMEALGVAPGSVTPFALISDRQGRVKVVLDRSMMNHERLNYHPLSNDATTTIASVDLLAFIRATGHEPDILTVAGGESA